MNVAFLIVCLVVAPVFLAIPFWQDYRRLRAFRLDEKRSRRRRDGASKRT